jgi:TetR/AcrR family transcriptional regulator, cholesterol catabolism regulator
MDIHFETFKQMAVLSMEDICREIFHENQHSIKIKKEPVAVKNLVNIFCTTLKLSNEKGFHTMSLRDLSSASGLSMGALYSYFSSKDELLEMIQNQGRRITGKILFDHLDGNDSPVEKMRTLVRAHLYLTEVMQPWFYFSYMETKNLDKTQRKRSIENELFTERIFNDILLEGQNSGVYKEIDPTLTAGALKALLQDWYVKRWKYTRRQVSVEAYAEFVIHFLESAILAAPAGVKGEAT